MRKKIKICTPRHPQTAPPSKSTPDDDDDVPIWPTQSVFFFYLRSSLQHYCCASHYFIFLFFRKDYFTLAPQWRTDRSHNNNIVVRARENGKSRRRRCIMLRFNVYLCVRRIQCVITAAVAFGFLRFLRFEQYSRFSHCFLFVYYMYIYIYLFFYDISRKRFTRILSCVMWYTPPPTTKSLSSRRPAADRIEFFSSGYFSQQLSVFFRHERTHSA